MICPICKRDGFEPSSFSQVFEATIRNRAMTAKAISKLIGVHETVISRTIHGSNPRLPTLIKLCDWAEIDIEWAVRSMVDAK